MIQISVNRLTWTELSWEKKEGRVNRGLELYSVVEGEHAEPTSFVRHFPRVPSKARVMVYHGEWSLVQILFWQRSETKGFSAVILSQFQSLKSWIHLESFWWNHYSKSEPRIWIQLLIDKHSKNAYFFHFPPAFPLGFLWQNVSDGKATITLLHLETSTRHLFL